MAGHRMTRYYRKEIISANTNKSFEQPVILAWQGMTPDDTDLCACHITRGG